VQKGFADFIGQLRPCGAGLHERDAVQHDARRQHTRGGAFFDGTADVEAKRFRIARVLDLAEVGGAGAVFDNDGNFVEPPRVRLRELADGCFYEVVESFTRNVDGEG
jgi:hypothetical protein